MKTSDFPALFVSADSAANASQKLYLLGIMAQYGLLFLSAIVALGPSDSTLVLSVYAALISVSTILLGYLAIIKPEKDWYGCRALAESFKTLSWRYMMNAEPFNSMLDGRAAREKFVERLKAVLDDNAHVRATLSRQPFKGEQITKKMIDIRAMTLDDRVKEYRELRIENQKTWYVKKAEYNKKKFNLHIALIILVQCAAIIMAIVRIKYGAYLYVWPTEPFLVFSSALIGWIQIKKFNELASAYSLTAHEIGLIQSRTDGFNTEEEFSAFVNDTELAFSREHTQWIARQSVS